MLDRLQRQLTDTYQAPVDHDVRDYLITDPRLAKLLAGESTLLSSSESLLVSEDEDGLALSLYLEQEILHRLESLDPSARLRAEQLDDLCKVIEGVSHFNYVVWRAEKDRSMSLLELELQAEVDKYVSTMQMALEQRDHDMLHGLHRHLFDNYRLRDDLEQDEVERYRAASEYAARFCRRLRRHLLQSGDGALEELRQFYRMSLNEKISHIHSKSFGSA
jgi:hypothetical protein